MKNRINDFAAVLACIAAMAGACNTLEVTLPRGPQGEQGLQGEQGIQGEQGKDGRSAYAVWALAVQEGLVTDWTGDTEITDFFRYLKGKDGLDGKDGKNGLNGVDGKDGKDGIDGKSAYELWTEYVGNGVEDPKNPGSMWDASRTTVHDFFDFLTGPDGPAGETPFIGENGNWWIGPVDTGEPARGEKGDPGISGADGIDGKDGKDGIDGKDGKDGINGKDGKDGLDGKDGKDGIDGKDGRDGSGGLSAYDLWVRDVTSEDGLENPGNGIYDIGEYPCWPKDAISVEDFYKYLTGRDGRDGADASSELQEEPFYSERVDGSKYNVAPVIALCRTSGGNRSYEYVNPFSGGAAFVVTGPGPVIIPGCEVAFTTMDGGKVYTKTSDESGYVYLTRDELPDWYDGAPSAADDSTDICSGVRPLSFRFGNVVVTDAGKIASTCKVPYKVCLTMELAEGMLKGGYSLAMYEVRRIVEGEKEEGCFLKGNPKVIVNDHRGYGCLHQVTSSYSYYRNEGSVKRIRDLYAASDEVHSSLPPASSGDGELSGFFGSIARLSPSELPSCVRTVGSESYFSPSFGDGAEPAVVDVNEAFIYLGGGLLRPRTYRPDYGMTVTDGGKKVHVPSITRLPETLTRKGYVWKSGHTTLTFELDWNSIGKLKVADGYGGSWEGDSYTYPYVPFNDMLKYTGTGFSSFRAKGKFNGSVIDSEVAIDWRKPVVFTDIYDKFSVSISDVSSNFVMFSGLSGNFDYDASEDDAEGNGKAHMFGQEIPKTVVLGD